MLLVGTYYFINCYEYAKKVEEEMNRWPHDHDGGGDKLVHCVSVCLIRSRYGSICAWLAARSTERGGNPFGPITPGGDPADEKANFDGYDCGGGQWGYNPSGNDFLDCQKCCHDKGYRRWRKRKVKSSLTL